MTGGNPVLDPNPFAYFAGDELTQGLSLGLTDLLKLWQVRQRIASRRWEVFRGSGAELVDMGNVPDALAAAHDHNLRAAGESFHIPSLLERPELLYRPMMSIDKVRDRASTAKVLTIGPRTEYEILILASYGFALDNITGLDLFTYSPWIEAGDMHEMSYEDNSFDVIVLGWVVSYSVNVTKLANEVIRVARPGAVVAIGVDYVPPTDVLGKGFEGRPMLAHPKEILEFFSRHLEYVFFQHEPAPEARDRQGNLIVVFDVKKRGGRK